MCGIFAYLGDKQALKLLINGLKRLEYRGYDSAGVAVHNGDSIGIARKVGKVVNMENISQGDPNLVGTIGIAHTRWATHGQPSDENSHPHSTSNMSVSVVHNGIITNYITLRRELQDKGYVFKSQTDTEVLCHLVDSIRQEFGEDKTWKAVIAAAMRLVHGTYGCVFLFHDEPDMMIGCRKGSPLLLGVGDGECFLASDGSAVVEHTTSVVYLSDDEMVEVNRGGHYSVSKITGFGLSNPKIHTLELSLDQIEKEGYPHFMLKEIMDQPNSLRNCIRGRLIKDSNENWNVRLGGLVSYVTPGQGPVYSPVSATPGSVSPLRHGNETALQVLRRASRVIIAACGTSWHAALIGEYFIEHLARLPVEVEYASEFRYRNPILLNGDVVIVISQSGETADTLEAVRIAEKNCVMTLGVVNVVGSTIARETDAGIYLHAGPEIGVASTKAFTAQVIVMSMLGLLLAKERQTITQSEMNRYCEQLAAIPEYVAEELVNASNTEKIAKYYRLASNFLFLGRGFNFPVALEGALKLKEISYIHAEGYAAAEMKHGPIALIDRFMPVVFIAMKSDPMYDKIVSNLEEVRARNGGLIVITEEHNDELNHLAEFVIHCKGVDQVFQPLLTVIPLQLLSYYIADLRGCNIDQPRNLAKSVTVE